MAEKEEKVDDVLKSMRYFASRIRENAKYEKHIDRLMDEATAKLIEGYANRIEEAVKRDYIKSKEEQQQKDSVHEGDI